jgi:UDP-N-acetylmuramoyl-L-alanyl-D-glutamate--2,6-diaminopimelate ligase
MVDAAETADQLAVLLKTARHSPTGRTICVCTANTQLTMEQRYHLGKVAERGNSLVVLTGENMVSGEVNYEPFHQVLDGMQRPSQAQVIPDRIRAIEWALQHAEPGDTVLVTGRGHRPWESPADAPWRVTDIDVCQAWLYERLPERETPSSDRPDSIYYIDDYR